MKIPRRKKSKVTRSRVNIIQADAVTAPVVINKDSKLSKDVVEEQASCETLIKNKTPDTQEKEDDEQVVIKTIE